MEAKIRSVDDEIQLIFNGDAFLRHQVRIMVGTLVEVGQGRRLADDVSSLIRARERQLSGPTSPARGLTLWSVNLAESPRALST